MAPYSTFISCVILTFSLSLHAISGVNYHVSNEVPNTPGGVRFTNEIGIPYTKQVMAASNNFIWSVVFQQNKPSDRKPVDLVNFYITVVKKDLAVTWGNNNINFSSDYIASYKGNVKREFTSIVYHEMTHVFQWDGEGTAPAGLIEGIAEYTKLKANYLQQGFPKPGEGNKWDEGYGITARFLEYCDGVARGFVAKINGKMRFTYNVKYFQDLTGKTVDQLWKEYNAKILIK